VRAHLVPVYLLEGAVLFMRTRARHAEEEAIGVYWEFLPAD